MRKSKYLILNNFYFNFNNDLTNIEYVKESFKNQNILDLFRFDKMIIIKNKHFQRGNINFIYLPQNIEIINEDVFANNKIEILDLSNCIKLKNIENWSFWNNQIKQLKLPKNIEEIRKSAFEDNQIESLDLSNCINLKFIESWSFWNKIVKYYNNNKMKSGDYKLENNKWQWYPL